ncbi:MAG: type II secretion system protein [Clostridia bacterium]|nr:type II secretion system protein [Clostridia bacterium]
MQKKEGISLIVLVITIIVMIILAAAVVISLNNTGVIDKASHAVQLTDEKQVQDLAALIWAEAYLDKDRTETLEKVVKDKLAEQGVTEEKWDIEISNTGATVTIKKEITVSGEWLLNDTLTEYSGTDIEQTVSFVSNGNTYIGIKVSENISYIPYETAMNELMLLNSSSNDNNGFTLLAEGFVPSVSYKPGPDIIPDDKEETTTEDTVVYSSNDGWVDNNYKSLDFGTAPQEVTKEFYNWLKNNATKQ